MNFLPAAFPRISLTILILCASACGGGGGSSNSATSADEVIPQDEPPVPMMSFEKDIEPIMQAKCLGCHNSGSNPLAPFSLEGIDRVTSFKSAMQFVLESHTMPPADAQQLTGSEHAKLTAWLTNQPYTYVTEILHIPLVEPIAWDVQPKNRDAFPDHRPAEVNCKQDTGWMVEEDVLEVRTEFCNYLSISQQSLLDLEAGTNLELVLSHSALNFNAPQRLLIAIQILKKIAAAIAHRPHRSAIHAHRHAVKAALHARLRRALGHRAVKSLRPRFMPILMTISAPSRPHIRNPRKIRRRPLNRTTAQQQCNDKNEIPHRPEC